MNKIIITLLLLVSYQTLHAQYFVPIETAKLDKSLISLNVLTPGISLEASLSDNKSIYLNAGAGVAFIYETINGQSETSYIIIPVIYGQYRNFYNLKKRERKFKKTEFNSGNFFGLHVGYQTEPIAGKNLHRFEVEEGFLVGPVWGIQRNGTFTFGLHLGLGVFTGNADNVVPITNIHVGFNLSKLGG